MQRILSKEGKELLLIDCNQLEHLKWERALHYIVCESYKQLKINYPYKENYIEFIENPAIRFEEDMQELTNLSNNKLILIMFDEIERISFEIADKEHWRKDGDFIYFWRIIKTYFQKNSNTFSFIIAGTNPKAIESPIVGQSESDNPLFEQLEIKYLDPFTKDDTENMINRLGVYMQLSFDEEVCMQMTRDFGGQPFVIRKFCSYVNSYLKEKNYKKPRKIEHALYNSIKNDFNKAGKLNSYFDMIINVLKKNYQKEYDILVNIALENYYEIESLKNKDTYISHLIGYGLIERKEEMLFDFKYETLKNHLISENKFKKEDKTDEEKLNEINKRVRNAEFKLQEIVKNRLMKELGRDKAKKCILDTLKTSNHYKKMDYYGFKEYFNNYTFEEIFEKSDVETLLSTLIYLIIKPINWPMFKDYFEPKNEFEMHMNTIKAMRNREAHPKKERIDINTFKGFRASMDWFEDRLIKNKLINT